MPKFAAVPGPHSSCAACRIPAHKSKLSSIFSGSSLAGTMLCYDLVVYVDRAEKVPVADIFTSDPFVVIKLRTPAGVTLDWR